jgi:hypothetical protein
MRGVRQLMAQAQGLRPNPLQGGLPERGCTCSRLDLAASPVDALDAEQVALLDLGHLPGEVSVGVCGGVCGGGAGRQAAGRDGCGAFGGRRRGRGAGTR